MSTHEIALALGFLYSTLSGDSTLAVYAPGGVYRALADEGSATPYVTYGYQAGSDISTMVGVRMIVDATFQVKASGPANQTTTIASAGAQIDVLLGGEEGLRNIVVPGGYIYAVWRQSPIWLDDPPVNAQIWTSAGGLYRIQISQSN